MSNIKINERNFIPTRIAYWRGLLSFICFIFLSTASQNTIAQEKVSLLFSDAFTDKEKKIPLPERYYNILMSLEKEMNITFDIQLYPWNRAIQLASTRGDLIFALSQTPERQKIFTFSEPITKNYMWLIARKDNYFSYTKIEDLKGKTIDIFRGAQYGNEFDKNKGKLFKIDEGSGTYFQRLIRLHNKRADCIVFASEFSQAKEVAKQINDIIQSHTTESNKDTNYTFKVIAKPVFVDEVRFAILTDSNDKLITRINQSIEKLNQKKQALPKSTK